jgi:hypothetical protein
MSRAFVGSGWLAAGVLCLGALASPGTSEEQAARLALKDANPVVVEGSGFVAGEPVMLTTSINGQQIERKVEADSKGCFTATLAEMDAECFPFRVSAEGERGSRAVTPQRIPPPCGAQIQE